MAEATHHDRSLADLIAERNSLLSSPPTKQGQMINLSEEEGHVFDHEPGMQDWHHDKYSHPEETAFHHQEYYAEARYPVFLDHQEEHDPYYYRDEYAPPVDEHHYNSELNDTESNLYHSWPQYSPMVPHDWMLHKKEKKSHSFTDFDEFEFAMQENSSTLGQEEDGLDFVSGLRRMSFEGLTDHDKIPDTQKAVIHKQPCKCVHGTEECCEF